MEFLRSFLRRHFAGKPVVAQRNFGCFLGLVLFIKVTDFTVTCFIAKCEPKFKQFGKDGQA